jgi:membrane-bound lytic murein transglycosylase D
MIARLLQEAALPEELGYLVLIESSFLPPAVSPSGAAGLWQFVRETAGKYGLRS